MPYPHFEIDVRLIYLFAWKLQTLEQWMPLRSRCYGQRSGQIAVLREDIACPLCLIVAKLVQWNPLESTLPLSMFSLYGRRSRSNCWSLYKCCQPNIFWLFCFKVAKLGTVDALSEDMIPIPFQIMCSKVKVKLLSCLILWISDWWLPNFATMFDFSEKIIPIALWVTQG